MSILQTSETLPFKYQDFSNEMGRMLVNSNLLIGRLQARSYLAGGNINILSPLDGKASISSPDTYEFNWLEQTIKPKISSLTAIAGTGTSFTVANSAIFRVNEVLRMTKVNNKAIDEKVLITAISSSTTLTVERDFGFGGAGQPAKVITDLNEGTEKLIFSHVLRAEAEKGSPLADKFTMPVRKQNYVELFKEAAELSDLQIRSRVYGINDADGQFILENFKQKYDSFIRQIDSALISGLRNSTTFGGTDGNAYQTGGILEFIEGRGRTVGNNIIDSGDTEISEDQFTDMFKYLGSNGCQTKDFAIVCGRTQSAKISKFATVGSNPIIYKEYAGLGLEQGQSISKINSNIADGTSGQIIVTDSIAEDKVYILDLSKIKVKPFSYQPFKETAYDGGETRTFVIKSRLGFEIRNGDSCHGVIKNLSV